MKKSVLWAAKRKKNNVYTNRDSLNDTCTTSIPKYFQRTMIKKSDKLYKTGNVSITNIRARFSLTTVAVKKK